jgi:hypothetical protein
MNAYLQPSFTQANPGNLTLTQFLQTVLTGVSGIKGTLVRPKWQPSPPQDPDITVDWLAFGIASIDPNFNAYIATTPDNTTQYQRHQQLEVQVSVYGPEAQDTVGLITDGLQIPQNLAGLLSANMGLVEVTKALHIPELINERFFNRYEFAVVLNRQVQRLYPILSFVSASGTIYTQTAENANYQQTFAAE